MGQFEDRFRDELINSEKTNSQLQEKYRKELENMLERKVEGWKLWAHVLYAIVCLGIGIRATIVGFSYYSTIEFTLVVHRALGAIGLFLLMKTVLIIWIIWKGRMDLVRMPIVYSWLAWSLSALVSYMFIACSSLALSVKVLIFALLILLVVSVIHIYQIMRTGGLKTREKLLQIELKLAELSEKFEK